MGFGFVHRHTKSKRLRQGKFTTAKRQFDGNPNPATAGGVASIQNRRSECRMAPLRIETENRFRGRRIAKTKAGQGCFDRSGNSKIRRGRKVF